MHVTMVKKELLDGSPCQKCAQAEALLRRRDLWSRIDEVVLAKEADPESAGMKLAKDRGVTLAPFFLVREGEREQVYTSVLALISERLTPPASGGSAGSAGAAGGGGGPPTEEEVAELNRRFEGAAPIAILKHVLGRYGKDAGIAFSGAEDVALIDLAATAGLSFSVFSLDTGRLHPETYRFIDQVRSHYGVTIDLVFPNHVKVEELVQKKGLFSFYDDGHGECCGIRKVEPLGRVLQGSRAWLTGQRRDQSPTRTNVPLFELDRAHPGKDGAMLKANPMAAWSLAETWDYLRGSGGPTNPLHERGFISIGCEPCTRATGPGEHERAGRWWWEEATKRECGLHVK
jgi:phosphoadenosine phosphosulfate reductase